MNLGGFMSEYELEDDNLQGLVFIKSLSWCDIKFVNK